jgi:hypothetical protein
LAASFIHSVRFWHLASFIATHHFVRFWTKADKGEVCDGLSANDPKRTLDGKP